MVAKEKTLFDLSSEKSLKGWYAVGVVRADEPLVFIDGRLKPLGLETDNLAAYPLNTAPVFPDRDTAERSIALLEDDVIPGELLGGETLGTLPLDGLFGFKYFFGRDVDRCVVPLDNATEGGLKGFVKSQIADLKASVQKRKDSIREFHQENVKDERMIAALKKASKPAKARGARKAKKKAKAKTKAKAKVGRPPKAKKAKRANLKLAASIKKAPANGRKKKAKRSR